MRKNFVTYYFGIFVFCIIYIGNSLAAEELDKAKSFLKNLTKKSLSKKETLMFIENFAITLQDERGDGVVTYIFNDKEYNRYQEGKIISKGAWRFTKLGSLRLFNGDIKLTWKIKISDENYILIKTKYQPIAKSYTFSYEPKNDYLSNIKK